MPNLDHRYILIEFRLHQHPQEHLIRFYSVERSMPGNFCDDIVCHGIHRLHTPFTVLDCQSTEIERMLWIVGLHGLQCFRCNLRRRSFRVLRCKKEEGSQECCHSSFLKFSRFSQQCLKTPVWQEKTPDHTNGQQNIAKISRQSTWIVVDRKYRTFLIRIVRGLEETVVSMVKNVVHVNMIRHCQVLLLVNEHDPA